MGKELTVETLRKYIPLKKVDLRKIILYHKILYDIKNETTGFGEKQICQITPK